MRAALSVVPPQASEEAFYDECLDWIKRQSSQFRSRLLRDLSELERQTQREDESSHILEGEIFRAEYGDVTEYMMPDSGTFTFRAPDGKLHCRPAGSQFYDVEMPSRVTCWYTSWHADCVPDVS